MNRTPKTTAMMFTEEMMRAHLREIAVPGTGKRMTRRVLKLPKGCFWVYDDLGTDGMWTDSNLDHGIWHAEEIACPYGQPGDLLWFREPMKVVGTGAGSVKIRYEADRYTSGILPWPSRLKERPVVGRCLSNGGPREFSRMTGLITAVRVERLQDISEEDAKSEGCDNSRSDAAQNVGWYEKPRRAFQRLWDSIYGTWDENPWVWVIEYQPMLVNVDDYLREAA